MISTKNSVGSSLNEYLSVETDGSIPSLIQSSDLIELISNNFIILTMSKWIINQCLIESYQIEIYPIKNSTDLNLHRFYSFQNSIDQIKIGNLQSNEEYQLNIKVNSQAGETIKIISFRTTNVNSPVNSKTKNPYFILITIIISFIFTLILSIIFFILIKFCRLHWKNTGKNLESNFLQIILWCCLLDLFIGQTRKLKPVILPSYPHPFHSSWLKSDNEFTIQNYTMNHTRPYSFTSGKKSLLFVFNLLKHFFVEDSQGNINPYAVTGCKDQDSWCKENQHTESIGMKKTKFDFFFKVFFNRISSIDNLF